MLLGDFLKEGISRLKSLYPPEEARDIVLTLCESRLGTGRYTYATDPDYSIAPDSLDSLSGDMDRLSAGEPLQYVLGYAWFLGRRFKVTTDVLIPRPETEILCQEAIKAFKDPRGRILDLCTGSGCVAWSLALELPGSVVYGVDISKAALAVASGQDLSSDRSSPVFLKADILDSPPLFPCGKFDLILSNPPYIMESQKKDMRPNVLDHEPSLALFVPDEDPLVFYRAVARWAEALLAEDGTGLVEINETLGSQTRDLFLGFGFGKVEIIDDFFGKNRFVKFMR
ncbi:MAG: peptide chain release factor N(5)-glutamine methyltransferase [Bacteroidales bacterium]|nr:peptide chain release factor N(5)-glutamine methyltransferase [Bacteroidales bacterium]